MLRFLMGENKFSVACNNFSKLHLIYFQILTVTRCMINHSRLPLFYCLCSLGCYVTNTDRKDGYIYSHRHYLLNLRQFSNFY